MFDSLRSQKRYDIETLSINTVLNKEHLYEKNHAENVHQKLIPALFLILVNNQTQPLQARNFFYKSDILKENL